MPALDTGGRIESDGLAMMHSGEIVLNAKATAALDKLHPGLADRLNAGKGTLDDAKRTLDVPLDVTAKRVPADLSGKRGKGRQGLIDTCLHCGAEYQVKVWTQVCCCSDCTAQLSVYANKAARQSAWAKGKKSA